MTMTTTEAGDWSRLRRRVIDALFAPVDAASLAVFRIGFGAILLWEVIRYFRHGWIQRYFITPPFHFTYYGFGWVTPWPGEGMFVHFFVLGILAAAVASGLFYRVTAPLLCAGFTYVFLLDEARYLNHFYLICLLAFVLAVVPANARWSLDAYRGSARSVPAWALWLVRFQVGVPYFFGGLAKINAEWVNGEPLRGWLAGRAAVPIVGPLLGTEWMVRTFAYGGLVFDLGIVPLLLYRRTRAVAFVVACAFHLTNSQIFSIGVFPFLMIVATTIFFPPHWPSRLIRQRSDIVTPAYEPPRGVTRRLRLVCAALACYVVVQLALPLRHHLYPGDVSWTEEGHRFSWHMKLRDKEAAARFFATDPMTANTFEVDWRRELANWQYEEMSTRPDMVLQFAHHLSARLAQERGHPVAVRAMVVASLNAGASRALVDPSVDLSTRSRTLLPADWITR
jgi:vitamin K-dependent gamma-carboxylase